MLSNCFVVFLLSFCFDIVEELEVDGRKVKGIVTRKGERLRAQCVVLCTGTFLNGILHTGTAQVPGGR
ncbi:MAG: FAD-dependent oxidoreductase, partial [Candidatus Kapaibacterium sp.]